MKVYEYLLQWFDPNDSDCSFVWFPDHVKTMRAAMPEFDFLSDYQLEFLWSEFSSNFYAAGYMMTFDGLMDDFSKLMFSTTTYEQMYYSVTEHPIPEKGTAASVT